jgi:hypothetical protein
VIAIVNDYPNDVSVVDFIENFVLTDHVMADVFEYANRSREEIKNLNGQLADMTNQMNELLSASDSYHLWKNIGIGLCALSVCILIALVIILIVMKRRQAALFSRVPTAEPRSTELTTQPVA